MLVVSFCGDYLVLCLCKFQADSFDIAVVLLIRAAPLSISTKKEQRPMIRFFVVGRRITVEIHRRLSVLLPKMKKTLSVHVKWFS